MLPLILIPGAQGRWEYMKPTVDALSTDFQVLTYSLHGRTMEDYVSQVSRTLDDHALERAVICGVSFGGLIALRFAALCPNRTVALVMVSTPGPGWHLRPRHQVYARLPWLFGPLFLAETPWRMRPEMSAALPNWRDRWAFNRAALRTFISAPVRFAALATRARLIERLDVRADCARVSAPTLIVTGERHLDRVVPAEGTSEYLQLIGNARGAVLQHTGHAGTMTRPHAFAALVREFVGAHVGAHPAVRPTRDQVA